MSKDTQRSSERDRMDWDEAAADALEIARQMAPDPSAMKPLKLRARFAAPLTNGVWFLPNEAGRANEVRSYGLHPFDLQPCL